MSSYKSYAILMILFGQFIMILFGFHKIDPKVFLMKNWGCQKEEDFKLLKNYHLKPLDSGTVSNYYIASNNVWALRCHKRFWPTKHAQYNSLFFRKPLLTSVTRLFPMGSCRMGPYTNYVDKILEIFDPPSPLCRQVYYISLCSSIDIWQTTFPLLVYVVCV